MGICRSSLLHEHQQHSVPFVLSVGLGPRNVIGNLLLGTTNLAAFEQLCSACLTSGMGEPLSNPRVFDAVGALTDRNLFCHSPRRINISTIGIIPGIKKLTELHPQVCFCPF